MKHLKWMVLTAFIWPTSMALADTGCHFVVNSRLSTAINGPDQKVSFRFTCREDMSLTSLSVHCEKALEPPAYKLSIQEDKGGRPSGISLGHGSVSPKAAGWASVPLNGIPLFSGKVYHLVIEPNLLRGGQHPVGTVGERNFASFSYTDMLNPFDPQDEKADKALNVLLYEKGGWKAQNRSPLYALYGSGQRLQGNPYDDFQLRPIHGNGTPGQPADDVLQGEVLHPHCGLNPKGFVVRVRKEGNPGAPLNYRVYSHEYLKHQANLAYSGQAAVAGQVTSSFRWVTIGIKGDVSQSFPPECRYVVFQTDAGYKDTSASGCKDCYVISDVANSGGLGEAADLTYDGGAHLSRATYSTDGGAHWVDEFERDANVVILGPDCPPGFSSPGTGVAPLPTPAPLLKELVP